MSVTISVDDAVSRELKKLKDLRGYDLVNGGGRRMNLEGIELISIKGFHAEPNNPEPQVAHITCQLNLKSYANAWKMQATVTYSAPIPDALVGTFSVQALSDYAKKTIFDITVTDSKVVASHRCDYEAVGDVSSHLGGIMADDINAIIKHKLLGNLPTSRGFDDSLVAEINDIIRERLFNKLMMQADKRPTSTMITKDIIRGLHQPMEAFVCGAQNYRFLTTKNEVEYNPSMNPELSPYLQLTVSTMLKYEAGYIIYIDTIYRTSYPYATPAPSNPKDIDNFLKKTTFDFNVIKVTFGINNDAKTPNLENKPYHSLSDAFDKDYAASYIQELLNDPSKAFNKVLSNALEDMLVKSKVSIGHRIKYAGERRLDTL